MKLTAAGVARAVRRRLLCRLDGAAGDDRCLSVDPPRPTGRRVLLSYTLNPFLRTPGVPFDHRHTADWECYQIAQAFLELGFGVDVIRYDNDRFRPRAAYAAVIDTLTNLERLAPMLPRGCVKIFHAVFTHWLFHNRAAYARYYALQQRRGVTLRPRRLLRPNLSVEHADVVTLKGNRVTEGTFAHAKRPILRVSGSSTISMPWPDRDVEAARRRFVWFGGAGLVHKGLDLVLEAFAGMPDLHLTVCGPIEQEPDFAAAFADELYRTPNISTLGWVDVKSPQFARLAAESLALVYPSCADACAGSVITCMHAGLIPIASAESGIDVLPAFGITLRECTVAEIRAAARALAERPAGDLREMSCTAWEVARATYTRERFAREIRTALSAIMHLEVSDVAAVV